MPKTRKVVILSHGSRDPMAQKEFVSLVHQYRKRHPDWIVAHAYLEMASPTLEKALEDLLEPVGPIDVLPLFLFHAKHMKVHIPEIVNSFRKKNPGTTVKLKKALGPDPKLLDILDRRLKA